jgi:hypothetical protein
MVSYERIFRITLIELESNCCADRLPMPSSAGAGSDRQCDDTPQKLPQFAKERAYGNPALAKPSAMR